MRLRLPDFPAMIAYLLEAGMTKAEVGDVLGVDPRTLDKYLEESSFIDTKGLRLLQKFLEVTDKDVPMLGDHHKIMNYY